MRLIASKNHFSPFLFSAGGFLSITPASPAAIRGAVFAALSFSQNP
jgi:hypothetical protein